MCHSATCAHSATESVNPYALDSASKTARRLLSHHTGQSLSSWNAVYRGYLAAKGKLIDALDGTTGRRTFTVEHAPTAREKWEAFRAALSDAVFKERAQAHGPALPPVGAKWETALRTFGENVREGEVDAGTVADDSRLIGLDKSIRKGQKLTRALGAYLRSQGASNDESSAVVDYVATHAHCKPRTGTVTISANILDILVCSMNCTYSSCHNFDGCYRAGPQHYLQDDCTLTVFYHERTKTLDGVELPYKTFRQMVYVDQERGAAALMRRYGQALPDTVYALIRREIALLLARLKGIDGEPLWFRADGGNLRIDHGANLAYVDGCAEYVQLVKGDDGRPHIALADSVPCAECGGDLDNHESLLCDDCDGGACECYACGCRMHEEDSRTDDCGDTYCDDCYNERYTSCERCGTEMSAEGDEIHVAPNGSQYCESCFDRRYCYCAECSEAIERDDAHNPPDDSGPLCDACYSDNYTDCEDCEEGFHNDDIDDGVCAECAAKRIRAARLLPRLIVSPRFARLAPNGRYVLCDLWERVTDLSSAGEDCAEPIIVAGAKARRGMPY